MRNPNIPNFKQVKLKACFPFREKEKDSDCGERYLNIKRQGWRIRRNIYELRQIKKKIRKNEIEIHKKTDIGKRYYCRNKER